MDRLRFVVRADRTTESIALATKQNPQSLNCQSNKRQTSSEGKKSKSKVSFPSKSMVKQDSKFLRKIRDNSSQNSSSVALNKKATRKVYVEYFYIRNWVRGSAKYVQGVLQIRGQADCTAKIKRKRRDFVSEKMKFQKFTRTRNRPICCTCKNIVN